jgi:DNA-binding response OmpR family regulator
MMGEASAFRTALLTERPRVVVLCVPPGSAADVDLVASERRRRPRLRVALLNGRDRVDERLDALRLGFDAALTLDLDPDELRGRLALLAEQTREPRNGNRLRIADGIELDLESRELRRDSRQTHLGPKVFGLLDCLARRPGRTFTRRQLLDRVWHQDRDGDQRTLDVHVRWLREKLEVDPEHPRLLLTVRGVGYRLDPDDR